MQFPDIELPTGEHLLITGASGTGKTTFLHLLAGLLESEKGEVWLAKTGFHTLNKRKKDHFRAQHIGLIFQVPHFIASLSVIQNLLWAQKLALGSFDKDKTLLWLTDLNLLHRCHAKPSELSQGELQRVSIIRGIIHAPTLVLADEPTSALDDANCHKVLELIENQCSKVNASLIVVTHDQRVKPHFTNRIEL